MVGTDARAMRRRASEPLGKVVSPKRRFEAIKMMAGDGPPIHQASNGTYGARRVHAEHHPRTEGARVRVAIVGFGVEGRAAAEHWRTAGHSVVVHDHRGIADPAPGIEVATSYLAGLDDVDLIVRTPSVRPESLPAGVPVTSVIREFMSLCPARVIGVTGTKGKGTTSTVAASILRAARRRVVVAGNIGTPPLALLRTLAADDIVVLELSSFQLMDLTVSPHVAVVLAITPDHLNWHRDQAEYERAKAPIAAFQTPDDLVVWTADSSPAARIAALSPARHRVPLCRPEGIDVHHDAIWFAGERVADVADVRLPGAHNLHNVAAAVAATRPFVTDTTTIRAGISEVAGLPHRLQTVAATNGVRWVDDSLSTTPETTLAAADAFDGPKVLILGGTSKGVSFEGLAAGLRERDVRAVLLTGDEAPRIAAALDAEDVGWEAAPGTMGEIVDRAAALARRGDVVLLSPACSSVGQYRDYADRGDQFAAAVRALAN